MARLINILDLEFNFNAECLEASITDSLVFKYLGDYKWLFVDGSILFKNGQGYWFKPPGSSGWIFITS